MFPRLVSNLPGENIDSVRLFFGVKLVCLLPGTVAHISNSSKWETEASLGHLARPCHKILKRTRDVGQW